jgi:hypothetical protein
VQTLKGEVARMEKIKFIPLTYGSDIKTYVKADTIVQLVEEEDKTFVYTINSDTPMIVKESANEILAKIGVSDGNN